jgi:hypothetical protein
MLGGDGKLKSNDVGDCAGLGPEESLISGVNNADDSRGLSGMVKRFLTGVKRGVSGLNGVGGRTAKTLGRRMSSVAIAP